MQVTAWLYPKSDGSQKQLLRAIHPEEFQVVSARYGVRVGSPALERILEAAETVDGLGRRCRSRRVDRGEYVLGAGVQQAFAAAGLSGYSLVPVVNPKTGSPWPEIAQIHSSSVLPKSMRDASVDRIVSRHEIENGKLRHLGCLAYAPEDLEGRPDFNRTGEPWRWWGFPSWVVSSRVERVFKEYRLRGWAFRQAFLAGTKLYEEYLGLWGELRRLVSRTRKSAFEGGRW